MKETNPQSFTIEYFGISNTLKTECGVCRAFNPSLNNGKHPEVKRFTALWDTGATNSVITKDVVEALALAPTGIGKVFHANGDCTANTYLVNILLPNNVGIPSLKVTEGILTGMDVLIGMDIITGGDFAISNSDGKTTFTFQMPPTHKHDFVKEHLDRQHTPIVKDKLPGRNDLCHCGSGKKYKNCHGK